MKNLSHSPKSLPLSRSNGTQAIADPAQPLRNPRWEQFAHLVLVMDQTKAYREAFPTSKDSKARHVWESAVPPEFRTIGLSGICIRPFVSFSGYRFHLSRWSEIRGEPQTFLTRS